MEIPKIKSLAGTIHFLAKYLIVVLWQIFKNATKINVVAPFMEPLIY